MNDVHDTVNVAIIGDYDPKNQRHEATINALHHAAERLSIPIQIEWTPTDSLVKQASDKLGAFDALWCAPGSPYRSFEGALRGIQFARVYDRPLLGTCGGFQHMVIEYARNVLGFQDAEHAEYNPEGSRLFVTRLACSPFGQTMMVKLDPESFVYKIYRKSVIAETYYCNFGLNPAYKDLIDSRGFHVAGVDEQGEARILELASNRFFVATLFVPQLSSSIDKPHPMIVSFLETALISKESDLAEPRIRSRA